VNSQIRKRFVAFITVSLARNKWAGLLALDLGLD